MSSMDTLREALEARGDTVAVPAHAVETAMRRGYRVRRRRRVAAGVGGAVLAAAVAIPIATGWSPTLDTEPAVPSPSVSQDPTHGVSTPPPSTPPLSTLPLGAPTTIPYAVGNVLVAGDLQVDMGGYVSEITVVGDAYAVISMTSDPDISRLDLVTPDGAIRELDRGWINGVVTGQEGSGIALAWGWTPSQQSGEGELKSLQTLDGSSTGYVPQGSAHLPVRVFGVSAGRVVFNYLADPMGPPQVYDRQVGTDGPLLPDVPDQEASFAGLTADGRTALLGSWADGCLTAYDVIDGDQQWTHCSATAAWLSPDGRWLVDHTGLYDAPTGEFVRPFDATYEWVTGIGWEDDDHVLLGGDGPEGRPIDEPLVRCTISTGACERVPIDVELPAGELIVLGQR